MFQQSTILRWRRYDEHYRLCGNQCINCAKIYYPKVCLCTCHSDSFRPYELTGLGTLISYTRITVPPAAFKDTGPYYLGLIALDNGPRIIAQLADVGLYQPTIGMQLQACLRKMYVSEENGSIHYGLKFTIL